MKSTKSMKNITCCKSRTRDKSITYIFKLEFYIMDESKTKEAYR